VEHPARRVLREIGGRIRASRQAAKLTQEQAADAAGIDYKRWQVLEGGRDNVTVQTLCRVAEACGTTFWEMLVALAPTRDFASRGAERSGPPGPSRRKAAPLAVNPRSPRARSPKRRR